MIASVPKTTPLPDWTDEDVFVIGGGSSLLGFDFNQLRDLNTVGCNQAFLLGGDVCHVTFFGDLDFYYQFYPKMCHYSGWVATNAGEKSLFPKWVRWYPRVQDQVTTQGLGWFGNSGCSAAHLALLLGARRVFLLGIDLRKGSREKTHWHEASLEAQDEHHYEKFAAGFELFARQVPTVFPKAKIYNVSEGQGRLTSFASLHFKDAGLLPPMS